MKTKPRHLTLGLLCLVPATSIGQWYQGPSGGTGGRTFDHWTESEGRKDISRVWMSRDGPMKCFAVEYRDRQASGGSKLFLKVDNCKDKPVFVPALELEPDEYMIGISGKYGAYIDSMTIHTNKGKTLSFGGPGGGAAVFGYTAPSGQMIVGFFGKAGDALDSIGVLYAPCTQQKRPCK